MIPGLAEEMRRSAEAGEVGRFLRCARQVHASDLSDVLAQLDEETQLRLVQALPAALVSEALAEMDQEEHPEELLAALRPEQAAGIVQELADDDAAVLIRELPPDSAKRILAAVANRGGLERLLAYQEDTAGGRMTTSVVSVPIAATISEALDSIRRQAEEAEPFYQVYGLDEHGRLAGLLSFQRLVLAPPAARVIDVMEPAAVVVRPEEDQEAVARLIARYNVAEVPVTDPLGRLLGRITFDDVIDVVEAETTEDLLRLSGVPVHEELAAPWWESVLARLPWLYVNTITSLLAAAVVYLFQDTIAALVLLTVYMPVVAGQGGNAGTQALAITVRRIALGLIPPGQSSRVVAKEVLVGTTNGLAVGLAVGLVATLVRGTPMLGVVVALAMWGNLIIAGLVGATVPLVLNKLGADPAVSSSVFVTPVTDAAGFLLLLSLASAMLL